MTTKAQIRAEAATRKVEALTAEVDRLDKERQLWAKWAQHAAGFAFALMNPRSQVAVQPDGFGHWAVILTTPERIGAWSGDGWGPMGVDYTELYRWELFEALAIADRWVADDAAEHARWQAGRSTAPAGATPIHDALHGVRTAVA